MIEAKANAFILLKDHPLLLFVFCAMLLIIVAAVTVIILSKTNPGIFNKWFDRVKGKKQCEKEIREKHENQLAKIENIFYEDALERKTRQTELDNRLDKIDGDLKKLFEIVADHEEFSDSVSQGTLENMVFNVNYPPFRRLKALRRLFALGANGRIKETGLKIIMENKETWKDVLDTKLKMKMKNEKFYNDTVAEIGRRVFS